MSDQDEIQMDPKAAPKGPVSDIDELLAGETREVTLPGLGGRTVLLRDLSAADIVKNAEMKADTPEQRKLRDDNLAKLIAKSVLSPAGTPLFNDDNALRIRELPMMAYMELQKQLIGAMGDEVKAVMAELVSADLIPVTEAASSEPAAAEDGAGED